MPARWLHRVAVAAFLALAALVLTWLLWLQPPSEALLPVALVTLGGPLAATAYGVIRGQRYTMAWSALLVLIHFIHGVTYVAVPNPARWLGAAEIVLVSIYFTAALMYLRQVASQRSGSRGQTAP
ncbi:MAG: DUF2069 domain-containing protein [Halomonas sp.]